ncbi:MAG: hypothetical protein U0271_46305 [Polyangiaceae bacterium]
MSAISRAAVGAYERETVFGELLPDGSAVPQSSHALCKSAAPAPATVPTGPIKLGDLDDEKNPFHSGDETTGWKCLKFGLEALPAVQLRYQAGSGYVGPAAGLPDPGPTGFEISATLPPDSDGKSKIMTYIGWVDPSTSTAHVSPEPYCSE